MVEMELVEMAAEFDEVGMGRTDVDERVERRN